MPRLTAAGPAAPSPTEQYYRVSEVADFLQVSPGTIWRLVWDGELRSIRIGKARRVPASAVQEFVALAAAPAGGR